MAQSTVFVGMDVHQDSVTIAVLPEEAQECEESRQLPHDLAKIRRVFARLSKRGTVRACYEASGCGYVLQRALAKWGVACQVIAPSLIPQRSGDRRKTDKRDAAKLARLYRAGELTAIRIPDEAEEQVRSLVRCRETLTREILKSRHYVLKLLLSRGHVYRAGGNGTRAHWDWLRQLDLEGADQITLRTYLELLEYKLIQRDTLDREIEGVAFSEAYREPVGRLRCLRGVDTLTAMTLVCEIGDVRRFASPRQLMGYLGLTVSETSSGGVERRGGITKTGNARARRVLVEAAWHYRYPARRSRSLDKRQEGQPSAVVTHGWRAQKRLHRKFEALVYRMAPAKAVVAVARELVGFVWALLHNDPALLQPRLR
ncbi:MAG: IS110 family RNA-guided transposase [Planctomycetota bacterium]